MPPRHKKLPALLLSLCLALGALTACNPQEAPTEIVRPVRALRVHSGLADASSSYAGEVRARYESALAFRVGGKIISRQAEIGSLVKAGQVLAALDPQDLQLASASARAQLAAARSERDLAQADFDRFAELFRKGFISKAESERRQALLTAAQSRHDALDAQFRQSGNQAGYATLRADHAGVITAVEAEAGQVVAAGQPVMRLARPDIKEAVISVPEHRVEALRGAKEIAVSLWADPAVFYAAKLREIAPATDPVTRTYTAKITLLDPPPAVRLGMTATVHVRDKTAGPTILLPLGAIHAPEKNPAVWVVDEKDSTVRLLPVTLGAFVDTRVTILSGLEDGQTVVTAGVNQLHAGQKVRVME